MRRFFENGREQLALRPFFCHTKKTGAPDGGSLSFFGLFTVTFRKSALHHFQRQLADSGVLEKLLQLGVEEDDTIRIGEYEFDYVF